MTMIVDKCSEHVSFDVVAAVDLDEREKTLLDPAAESYLGAIQLGCSHGQSIQNLVWTGRCPSCAAQWGARA
jgi:hypothetical protein